jgi:hypothetical protein
MYQTVQTCNHCGANLTLDDMRRTDCPYCKTVYPHHSQAAQHAQVVNQVMGQMMGQQAQVQDAWRAQFGLGPLPPPPGGYGNPYVHPHQVMQAHMAQAARTSRTIGLVITLSVVGMMLVIGLVTVLMVLR